MIKFYNTINRKKEEFKPIDKSQVTLYTCGPTVYDYAHIGNFRAYIFEDLLRRTLEFSGYRVLHVMNITDIDDKTIRESIKEKKSLTDFTNVYTEAFFKDIESLNIIPAHHYPRATNYIDKMIGIIKELESKGYTYTADDGTVFFKISSFPEYGKLSNINPEEMKVGERVDQDEYDKEEARDFALWKGYKNEDGDVFWDSPWGKGRPGWHIECSAMSIDLLGSHFDIHCGGVDNIFPHHENEIAQSCAAYETDFVNYWLHNEHLKVEGDKMSKSLGNFYTLRDLVSKGYSPSAIRYSLLSTHYRQKLNFTFEKLDIANKAINKLKELKRKAIEIADNSSQAKQFDGNYNVDTDKMLNMFSENLYNDLNISGALGIAFTWVSSSFKKIDEENFSKDDADICLSALFEIDKIIGVLEQEIEIPEKVKKLISEREIARNEKKWDESDRIRDLVFSMGFSLEDSPSGTICKKI